MKCDIKETDKIIIGFLQEDIPLESNPFQKLAYKMGLSEQEIVERIHALREEGFIKRCGAVLRHQQAGYNANAIVAFKVEIKQADEAGSILAEFSEISHCYLRRVASSFGYNLFAMVHSRSNAELLQLVDRISEKTGLKDYVLIRSLKEYKKASMKYI